VSGENNLAGKILRIVKPRSPASRPVQHFGAIETVAEYWNALSRGFAIPRRHEVDPRELGVTLAHCFILERIAPGVGRIRLAGQHLTALLGLDARGMPLTALFEPQDRMKAAQALEDCCAGPASVRLDLTATGSLGREALAGQMYLAPLRAQDNQPNRALGCLQTIGKIGRQPRRLSISDMRVTPIEFAHAFLDTATPPSLAFAEPAGAFQPAAPAPDRPAAARLRLVVNND